MKPGPKPRAARLEGRYRVDDATGCWIWTAATMGSGYGVVRHHGHLTGAHRVSWELRNGLIPEGAVILHRCDNPPCVNPDHLSVGTHADNMADMKAKGRQGRAKLTPDDVRAIRQAFIRGSRLFGVRGLARRFGVSRRAIDFVVRGESWTQVSPC